MPCMAVPKPTGLYLRTWMVYSGKPHLSPDADWILVPHPLGLGLVLGEAVEGVGVRPCLASHLLLPLSSLMENACKVILRKLIQDINFF